MNNLFEAIYTYYGSDPLDPFYLSTGGKFAFTVAPQHWEDKYVVCSHLLTNPIPVMDSGNNAHEVFFRLHVIAIDRSDAGDLNSECRSMFSGKKIPVTGAYDVILIEEESSPLILEPGGVLWSMSTNFRTSIQQEN